MSQTQLTLNDLIRAAEVDTRIPINAPAWYGNREDGITEVVGFEWGGDVWSGCAVWYVLLRFPGDHKYAVRCHPEQEGRMWGLV